jgi:hypothetical protein
MHQVGHFVSTFISYSPPGGLDLGVKLSRASFTRSGNYGSSNYWDYASNSSSLWANMEMRAQFRRTVHGAQ